MSEIRMNRSAALVIRALAAGHVYGFDIMDATGLSSGTVYPTLRRLEKASLASSSWEDRGAATREGRPRRRMFELTPEGRRAVPEANAQLAKAAALLADLLGDPAAHG